MSFTTSTNNKNYVLLIFCILLLSPNLSSSANNYNSVMLGDRAGGMGGAFMALTGDAAASAFYNPAALARLDASSISASINLFNKYDLTYGGQEKLGDSIFRINKGSILSVPSASGIFSSFRNFTAGLSVIIPEFKTFGGDVYSSGQNSSFLRVNDQSLWIGGAFGFNLNEQLALGFNTYYTSRSFSQSLTNRYDTGTETIVENEEKTFSTNSIIYSLGAFYSLNTNWSFGLGYRFRSLPIAGEGNYLLSEVGTVSGAQPIVRDNSLKATTRTPDQISWGVAYQRPEKWTLSLDIKTYGTNKYTDLENYGDSVEQKRIFNYALGYEVYLQPWIAWRLGLFTDFSASPTIPATADRRYQDRIDKYGFSMNFGIHTTEHTTLSLGGYYLGGEGWATEKIGAGYQRIKKADRLFSFLVGSSYHF